MGNTTMFCGDGINDLAALSAADVGMAIGATDAVIAATLSTSQGSVAGQQCPTRLLLLPCFMLWFGTTCWPLAAYTVSL